MAKLIGSMLPSWEAACSEFVENIFAYFNFMNA